MIIISDCSKDIVIPAGLGDNPGVVYETAGVKSLNGETGDLKIKTVNGNDMLGDGNVAIDTGVETLNGQKGALTLKTVNGNELTGDGNIEIQAGVESVNGETGNVIVKSLKYKEVNNTTKKEVYADVKAHWSNESGYTGDYVYYFMRNGDEILFSRFKINDYALIMTAVLPENIDLTINGEVVLVSCIVFSDESQNVEFRYHRFTIPTNVSQLTNDSNYQTKTEVDTAIENAVSGAGSDSIIVLDGLTQEERKAVYDKLDKTIAPNAVFIWENSPSFNAFWNGEYVAFDSFKVENKGLMIHKWFLKPDGNISPEIEPYMHVNSLFLNLRDHVDENADFNCDYYGDYQQYMTTDNTYPNSYYIKLPNGIGDTNKYIFTPVTVVKDGPYDPKGIRIQFTANEKLYTYLHGDADGKWLFESAKPLGGVQSSEVSNIKVLTQAEYDGLTAKDENVLYCIKG